MAVAVLSVGQRCVIAARRHSVPAESATTLMSIATPPIPWFKFNAQVIISLNFPACLYMERCSAVQEQCRLGWLCGVGDGVVRSYSPLWRQLIEAVSLAQCSFMSLQLQAQQEEKPNLSMCIFNSWQYHYVGREGVVFGPLESFGIVSSVHKCYPYVPLFLQRHQIFMLSEKHPNTILHIMLLHNRAGQWN